MTRSALCLAVLAAIVAPFAFGTWQAEPNAQSWIALTGEHRARILVKLETSANCRYFETQVEARDVLGLKVDSTDIQDAILCHREQDALRDGGEMRPRFSLPRYLAVNGAISLASALAMLGLAMLIPLLLRRYRWRPGN